MLYFRALLQGLDNIPAIDPEIRVAIEREGRECGWPSLHQQLAAVDPARGKLHPTTASASAGRWRLPRHWRAVK